MRRSASAVWSSTVTPYIPLSQVRRLKLPAIALFSCSILLAAFNVKVWPSSSLSRTPRYISSGVFSSEGLKISGNLMTMDGTPFKIYAGEIHYFRLAEQSWQDSLAKLRAAGLNTVDTVVPWNLHEPQPGEHVFDSSAAANGLDLDIVKFLKTAQDLGLHAIVRIGPYVGAGLDWGGLPSWLLRDPQMHVRSMYPGFVSAAERHLKELLELLRPLQYPNGGPIIAFSLEDDYGSYGGDTEYLGWLARFVVNNGVSVPLLTTESEGSELLANIPAQVLPTLVLSGQDSIDAVTRFKASKHNDHPLMLGRFECGFPLYWNNADEELHAGQTLSTSIFQQRLRTVLEQGFSFSIHMFHAGHNFGFINGALRSHESSKTESNVKINPLITSIRDAILSESGQITAKWNITRELMSNFMSQSVPAELAVSLNSELNTLDFGSCTFDEYVPVQKLLELEPTKLELQRDDGPNFVEVLCKPDDQNCSFAQSFGYSLYRLLISAAELQDLGASGKKSDGAKKRAKREQKPPGNSTANTTAEPPWETTSVPKQPPKAKRNLNFSLKLEFADRAILLINGVPHGTYGGRSKSFTSATQTLVTTFNQSSAKDLEILIITENLGRIHREKRPHKFDDQRKGLRLAQLKSKEGSVTAGRWEFFSLDFSLAQSQKWKLPWAPIPQAGNYSNSPALYRCRFNVSTQPGGDTFLNAKEWSEGNALVNGFNLGRYFAKDGHAKLFVHGSKLKMGINEVVLFELFDRGKTVSLEATGDNE